MSSPGNKRNYYKLLGIPRDASSEEIDRAYNAILASVDDLEDINLSPELLSLAHKTLLDPDKRSQYDQTLPAGIYYYEATQCLDWNSNQPVPKEKDSASAEILELNSFKAVAPVSLQRQVFGNLALDLEEEEEYGNPPHKKKVQTLKSLKREYDEVRPIYEMFGKTQHDKVDRVLLHIGLWSPALTLSGAIAYLLLS